MRTERYLSFVASFLIVIVLTIPFYTSGVYAAINKVSVKGGDGIEGFAKADDFLNFNVQASISSDTVTNEQVVLGSGKQFDKCNPSVSNGSECTLRFPGNGTEPFEARSVAFTVNLFKDDKTLDDLKTGSITVDNKAPQVRLTSQPKFSSQQNVVIGYDVADYACDDPSCNNKCVGIKSIDFYTQNGAFRQTVNPATGDCSVKSSISIDPKTFNDGMNSVFAKATDKFNQVSAESSATFAVDTNGPLISADSFAIMSKGINLNTFPLSELKVDVSVNIQGNDLNLNSVTADLSSLNPSQNLKNAKASCTSVSDGLSTCKWSITLNPGTSGLKNIAVNASDTSGNQESALISKSLSVDDKGPVVQSLSTATASQGLVLARAGGNTVTAVFDEASGLSADKAFLHVASSSIPASSCSKDTNWVCKWENVNFGSSTQISIQSDTQDILGNGVLEQKSVEVTLDSKAPVLKIIDITNIGGLFQAFPGFPKIGDKIVVVANLTEDNDVFAVADFSKFVSGNSKVAGSCERTQADEHICTWLTGSVNLEASGSITFNFSDNAGNALKVTKPFRTFGLENSTVPDFWSNSVSCSPSTIDRQLGPLINQRAYCQVALRQKSSSRAVSTVFIGPATCTGDTSLVQNIETLNTGVGSTSPVIKITLKEDDFKINNASLSCSFSIFSKIGSSTTVTKNPEIENANIKLEFFNNPLGELGQEVQDKIKEAKEDAEGIYDLIGTLNKIVFYAKRICQFIQIFYNIVGVLFTVAVAVNLVDAATDKIPFISALGLATVKPSAIASCQTETSTRVVAQNMNNVVNKFCAYVNCKQALLFGPAVQNFINEKMGSYFGPRYELKEGGLFGFKTYALDANGNPITKGDGTALYQGGPVAFGRPLSDYLNPNNNLIVATLYVCLPGIVYGLDKYRQIKCLYADCLQNAVGREGLPVTACEDQKYYATCKYVTGEIFAAFPWTALFDHFMGLIKNALSNPFIALGAAISLGCRYVCSIPEGATRSAAFIGCETVKLFSQIGSIASDVKEIIANGFTIRTDYCSRLEDDKETAPSTATATPVKK